MIKPHLLTCLLILLLSTPLTQSCTKNPNPAAQSLKSSTDSVKNGVNRNSTEDSINNSIKSKEPAPKDSAEKAKFLEDELASMVTLKLITQKQSNGLRNILETVEVEHITSPGVRVKNLLIVHKIVAPDIVNIFKEMADSGFIIEKIEPMSKYQWNDRKSMAANNTSAFNYRLVAGTKSISRHANGLALDINPLWNPYVSGKYVSPPGAIYDIKKPGTIHKDSPAYKIFLKHGWKWGGSWTPYKDYQHFFYEVIPVKRF